MRLIPASGSPDMQEALKHTYVQILVEILLQVRDRSFFRLIVQFLKGHEQRTSLKFAQDLTALSSYYQRRPNSEGIFIIPPYIDELIQIVDKFYQQTEKKIQYQRGAILELLIRKLVCPRYQSGECAGNQRFVDERGKNITDQVDVAALSHKLYQVEGYECKIKIAGFASEDCTNLIALTNAAQAQDYRSNVGVVSFDNDWLVKERIKHFDASLSLKSYGLDTLVTLHDTPF